MNKKKLLISLALVLGIGAVATIGVMNSMGESAASVEVVSPEMETISAEIMVPGTVELVDMQRVYADASLGNDYEILVEVGDEVEEGTPLIEYSSRQLETERSQLELQIESSYLRINHLEKQEKELQKKEKELRDELGKEEADKTIQPEKDQLDFEKRSANLDLRQLQIQKDGLEEQKKDLVVKSRGDGTVMTVNDHLQQGQDGMTKPVLEIASAGELQLQGKISEYDSLVISEEQEVRISSDALPEEEWEGTVKEVSYFPSEAETLGNDAGIVQYPITVQLSGDQSKLKPGYQMIMHIVTEEKTALTVPLEAVHQGDEGSYVYVVEDGKARQVEVETGLVENSRIEVIRGLEETDQVIVSDGVLTDGMDVVSVD
ncbi:efflux RND transporter periplasmic adaptor subunit [Halalkalibacterium halodurans]|uniref:efflux RND transporter periplasmic adaptor subunit n=1 Tax=Halalkalibacterium halodurans TaxID=86665 RepID=UPI0010FF4962|nr:efflux RND transporter periplasmic adaptor subunit [Halalkalibacterium halodurans]